MTLELFHWGELLHSFRENIWSLISVGELHIIYFMINGITESRVSFIFLVQLYFVSSVTFYSLVEKTAKRWKALMANFVAATWKVWSFIRYECAPVVWMESFNLRLQWFWHCFWLLWISIATLPLLEKTLHQFCNSLPTKVLCHHATLQRCVTTQRTGASETTFFNQPKTPKFNQSWETGYVYFLLIGWLVRKQCVGCLSNFFSFFV